MTESTIGSAVGKAGASPSAVLGWWQSCCLDENIVAIKNMQNGLRRRPTAEAYSSGNSGGSGGQVVVIGDGCRVGAVGGGVFSECAALAVGSARANKIFSVLRVDVDRFVRSLGFPVPFFLPLSSQRSFRTSLMPGGSSELPPAFSSSILPSPSSRLVVLENLNRLGSA